MAEPWAEEARRSCSKMDEVHLESNQHLLSAFPSVELKINEGIALPERGAPEKSGPSSG